MDKPNKKKVFYWLDIEDIQIVSEQEIGRDLTNEEINLIKDSIAAKINWYDAIAEAIHQKF